ncbi:MAG: hypothetical protein IH602_01055 [Bryobacteraceae bacterium]|nr:hypothetical protein [Bryobacteraceae bacterium]
MADRIVFSFDQRSRDSLIRVTDRGGYPSMGATIRDALHLLETLQDQAAEGFSQVIVRKPRGKEQRFLVLPRFISNMERLDGESESEPGPQRQTVVASGPECS